MKLFKYKLECGHVAYLPEIHADLTFCFECATLRKIIGKIER